MKENFKSIALILLLILLPVIGVGVGIYAYINRERETPNITIPNANIHDPNGSKKSTVYTQNTYLLTVEAVLGNDYISTKDGRSYLLVTLNTPKVENEEELLNKRKPLNLSIVIDRSGSMSGDKLDYVKEALYQLAEDLKQEDLVNIVIYDDVVEVIYESGEKGFDKEEFISKIGDVESRGSTNLEGGLRKGMELVESDISNKYHNRVILLSDGLANVGVSNADQLVGIVEDNSNNEINVSTIGVGVDYDEKIMTSVAKAGRGNYYFLADPKEAKDVFASEFNSMSTLLVDNIEIKFNTHEQFEVSKGIGYELKEKTGFKPYSLEADNSVTYLFEINAKDKETLSANDISLLNLEISYEPVTLENIQKMENLTIPVNATLTEDNINMLADDSVYLAFVEGYKTEKLWAVYEELDKNENSIANNELKELITFYEKANIRLDGELDQDLEELKKKQAVTEEYETTGGYVNNSSKGRLFQKDNQAESFDSLNK